MFVFQAAKTRELYPKFVHIPSNSEKKISNTGNKQHFALIKIISPSTSM